MSKKTPLTPPKKGTSPTTPTKGTAPTVPTKGTVPTFPTAARPKSNLLYYLIVLCVLGNFFPYIITTSVNCYNARGFVRRAAFDHLISVRDIKKKELEAFFAKRRGDAQQIRTNPLYKWAIASYVEAYKKGGVDGSDYVDVDNRYGRSFKGVADSYGYYDIYVLDMAGNVVYSARRHPELGKNVLAPPYADTPLAEAYRRGKAAVTLGDIKWYEPYNGPARFDSAPVMEEGQDEPFAVIVFHMDGSVINEMMSERPGLKETGEPYLVAQDLLMRSDSLFTPWSDVLKEKVDTVASREALAGNTDCRIIRDYRNVPVLSAYAPLEIASG
ncbi:MAG TPA: cache domain-containing protein, partial [Candidatus Hypogeohydataceae bacterium YC40]